MIISIGNDHAALSLKKAVVEHLEKRGITVIDCGCCTPDSVDYPVHAKAAARLVAEGKADLGIVLCGTGLGVSYAANKIRGIRCALCTDTYMARMAREHNNANMLAMGQRVIGEGLAIDILDSFLDTPFSGDPRHQRRLDLLEE